MQLLAVLLESNRLTHCVVTLSSCSYDKECHINPLSTNTKGQLWGVTCWPCLRRVAYPSSDEHTMVRFVHLTNRYKAAPPPSPPLHCCVWWLRNSALIHAMPAYTLWVLAAPTCTLPPPAHLLGPTRDQQQLKAPCSLGPGRGANKCYGMLVGGQRLQNAAPECLGACFPIMQYLSSSTISL